jgi:hypothetical protein
MIVPIGTKQERVLDRELGGGQLEEHEIDVVQGEVLERHERGGDVRERRVEQRAVGQEHRTQQHDEHEGERHPIVPVELDQPRIALLAADYRIAPAPEDEVLGAQQQHCEHEQRH